MSTRRHKVLFDRDLPFKGKVERDRTKFYRPNTKYLADGEAEPHICGLPGDYYDRCIACEKILLNGQT